MSAKSITSIIIAMEANHTCNTHARAHARAHTHTHGHTHTHTDTHTYDITYKYRYIYLYHITTFEVNNLSKYNNNNNITRNTSLIYLQQVDPMVATFMS